MEVGWLEIPFCIKLRNSQNVPTGYVVTRVEAVDSDEGTNGEVRCDDVTPAPRASAMFLDSVRVCGKPGGSQTGLQEVRDSLRNWGRYDAELHRPRGAGSLLRRQAFPRAKSTLFLQLEARAYDLGIPSYDDRRSLKVVALDEDDNPPKFDRAKFPPPHPVSVLEEQAEIFVGNLSLAEDPDLGNNSIICYYIVGATFCEENHFVIFMYGVSQEAPSRIKAGFTSTKPAAGCGWMLRSTERKFPPWISSLRPQMTAAGAKHSISCLCTTLTSERIVVFNIVMYGVLKEFCNSVSYQIVMIGQLLIGRNS